MPTITITPNSRLALNLQRAYATEQQRVSKAVWTPMTVQPLASWLATCWQQLGDQRCILSDHREAAIWEQIIQDRYPHPLLQRNNTALRAKQAWHTLAQWRVPLDTLADQHNEEVGHFLQWALAYQEYCEQALWISPAELPNALSEKNVASISLDHHYQFIGFDEFTPAVQHWINTLIQHGAQVDYPEDDTIAEATQHRIGLPHQIQEITSMARWAKQQHLANPNARIACVVPSLNQLRTDIIAAFQREYPDDPDQFNLSAGQSLYQFELIHTALLLLQFTQHKISYADFSYLIQSPYLSLTTDDRAQAARLDTKLRESNLTQYQLHDIITQANTANNRFSLLLNNAQQSNTEGQTTQLPSEWAEDFSQWLNSIQWPGKRSLSSLEYQLLQRWNALLEQLSDLDDILGEIHPSTAIAKLTQLAKTQCFQAEGSRAPIQVLGLLETAGLSFDALWVMDLHDGVWPPAAKPNPFIPIDLQRRLGMPHASAARELTYSQQLLQRLSHSAKTVILSYPMQQGDQPLQPSQLIRTIPLITSHELLSAQTVTDNTTQVTSLELESITDNQAPKIHPDEIVHGGSWILSQQAQCPFQAFAHIRLQAHSPAIPSPGLSAMDKGSLVHAALDHLWGEITDHSRLCAMSEQELMTQIRESVAQAIEQASEQTSEQARAETTYTLTIEKQRLGDLLFRWLEHEKRRPPFSVVARELACTTTLGNLTLNLRIDRIDQTDQGYLVIDYKTGITSMQPWFAERLTQPQLPLYCLVELDYQPIRSISFASLHTRKLQFNGIAADEMEIKSIVPIDSLAEQHNWHEQTAIWQAQLLALSHEFYSGVADVNPFDPQQCDYCDLQALCRIHHV